MGLEHIFSEESMLGYAGACIELAVDIPTERHMHPFDTLLIPSRGAVPFFLGMSYALHKFISWSPEHNDFHRNLGVPSMIESLIPEDVELHVGVNKKQIRTLLIPFTADLNIQRFDFFQGNEEYTTKTRRYWANVVASFLQSQRKRKNDPYFASFLEVILRDIENREELADSYESFPRAEQFAMIDTVISGRASNEILRTFDSLNLSPSTFLVVDEGGNKLRNRLKAYLETKEAVQQVRTYDVPRIVSEDEGASLEGVVAVVYPSVMRASKDLETGGKEFFVGAGSWHIGPPDPYLKNFEKFMKLVYSAIDARYALDYVGQGEEELEEFRERRKDFLGYADRRNILRKHDGDPRDFKGNENYVIEDSYETGSHVVHVPFDRDSTEKIMAKLLSLPSVRYKADSET